MAEVRVEPLADAADGELLVGAPRDRLVDARVGDVAASAPLDHPLQLVEAVEAHERARVRIEAVDAADLVAVRVVEDGRVAVLRLEARAVQLHLVAPRLRVDAGLLRLDDRQRLSVLAEEHVVAESLARGIGHAVHLDLDAGLLGDTLVFNLQHVPAGLLQIGVDVEPARGRFREVAGRFPDAARRFEEVDERLEHLEVALGDLHLGALHLLPVLRVRAEDADVVERVQDVAGANGVRDDGIGKHFEHRGLFGRGGALQPEKLAQGGNRRLLRRLRAALEL